MSFSVSFTYMHFIYVYRLHELRGSYSRSLKIHAQPHCFVIIKKGEIVSPKGLPLFVYFDDNKTVEVVCLLMIV